MAYEIASDEALSAGVRRVAREEVDGSLARLRRVAAGDGDRGSEVHEARKSWKRLRGLVRLVRGALGEETYRRENVTFRDAGRRLSPVRDAQVLEETLGLLDGDADDTGTIFPELHREIVRHRRETVAAVLDATSAAHEVIAELEAARERIAGWTVGEGWASVEPGIEKTYRRGRKALQAARDEPTTEHLHEWRKRVKYLWYQVRLLVPTWADVLAAQAAELHHLSDLLGDDHDLATLHAFAAEREPVRRAIGEERLADLERRVARRREELQDEAWPLGARLYAEKPKRFLQRLASYWEAADRP